MDVSSASMAGPMGRDGEIILDAPSPAVDCRVSNITAAGAVLTMPAGLAVPDAFTLAIAGEFVMRRCRVVWRRRGRVGVAFEMPA
ncbi:PilZ domain-containing protein [Methylobacterium sp. Gmos1]